MTVQRGYMFPAKYRICVPREQYAADKAGAGTTLERTAPIPRPRPHEGAALLFSKFDYRVNTLMDKKLSAPASAGSGPLSQALFIDGCKVTVTYSGQNNPNAVRAIRDILIGSISAQKG